MNFKLIKHIPNFLTCINLLCGCIAIVFTANGPLGVASYFVLIGMLFDFTDGMAARLLKAHSEIGKQLDSLGDIITFGVAPSFILYRLISLELGIGNYLLIIHYPLLNTLLPYSAFLIAIFSALRLAKFNIDTRQVDGFIGLPTPANALFFVSLPLIIDHHLFFITYSSLFILFVLGLVIIFSYLLVSPIKMFALKFKNFTWSDNKIRYIFVIISVLLILVSCVLGLVFVSLPLIVILYILMSLFTLKEPINK